MYRNCNDIGYVCRKYHISRTSLWRWNKKYDGSRESLEDKSHRPLSKHPKEHTETEIKGTSKKHNQKYHTPTEIGKKWQIDVKYVPKECKTEGMTKDINYYQYITFLYISNTLFFFIIIKKIKISITNKNL